MEWSELGERVRESRLAAGLSQAELGERVGLDRTMVAKIEAGSRRVDAFEMVRLASVLDVEIDHFLMPRPAVLSRRGQLVDDTDTGAARLAYRIEATLHAWLRDVEQLVGLGVLTLRPTLLYPRPVSRPAAAKEAAEWTRDRLGLGAGPIETLMTVCERAGQLVLVTDLPGDGASLVEGDIAVAVVGREADPGRRRATAAHELGHLVLGDEYSSDLGVSASRREREDLIDIYAAELLLPGDAVRSIPGDDLRSELVALAATYRTSWSLAVRQAVSVGLIPSRGASKWSSASPTRAELMEAVGWAPQPDLDSIRVPAGYARAVMDAWRADLITSARVVELMHGQLGPDDLPFRQDSDPEP